MKARSMQRHSSQLLPIILLVLALSLLAVACGTDGERSSEPDPTSSEQRQDSGEPPPEEEQESDREDDSDDESGGVEEQSEEEAKEPEPTAETARDTVILKRLTGGDSGSFAGDFLSLLPASDLFMSLTAYDVEAIRSAGGIREPLQRELDASFGFLGNYCIALDDVDTIVTRGDWNELLLVEGSFSIADLRALLEGDGYEPETYRGHELWSAAADTESAYGVSGPVAVFEERNVLLLGRDRHLRQALKDLNRGNESFLEKDSHLQQVFDRTGNGLKVRLRTLCSGEHCQVFAFAIVTAPSEEEYAADIELVVLAESDDAAEAVKDDVRMSIEMDHRGVIEVLDAGHETDGEYVLVRATVDEESVEAWQGYRFPVKIVYKPGSFGQQAASPAVTTGEAPPQRECP